MSLSRRSHSSAYQVYSSSQYPKSDRHNRQHASNDLHFNRYRDSLNRSSDSKRDKHSGSSGSRGLQRNRERSYDSDDEVLKDVAPRSLMTGSFSPAGSKGHSSGKQRMFNSSSHRDSPRGKNVDTVKKTSARSLMDIDFSSSRGNSSSKGAMSRWKDTSHYGYSSDDDAHERLDRRNDWKGGRRFSKYSDSDEEEDSEIWHDSGNRGRRSWKDSSSGQHPSTSTSRHAPLIVDLPDRTNHNVNRRHSGDTHPKPKPLLETIVSPPAKKPISLLDLPDSGDANFKRKPFSRSEQGMTNMNRKQDRGPKISSRKRKTSDDEQEKVKRPKTVKTKSDDKVAVVDSTRISVCKSTGHTFLVIPSTCSPLYLHGRAQITTIMGNIKILQYELHAGHTYDVFSPASGPLLALHVGDSTKFKAADVREKLSKYNIPENDRDLENIGNNTVAVIMLDKLESALCDYVTSFIPYTQLFTAVPSRDLDLSDLKGVTLPKLGMKVAPLKEMVPACLNMSQDYEDVLNKWTKMLTSGSEAKKPPPVLLCCGAKNTGKSTFNRMLINTTLKSVSAVGYLECDVGQTEFSPPATVSLHVIKQPVLGPPFCHQRHAEKMAFYGDVSPSQDPTLYIKCLKFIVEAYRELNPAIPLIVNTMGFPEGIGVMLLIDTAQLVEPDLVVQIESFNQAANLPAITHEFVALEEGWTYNKTPAKDPKQKMAETHEHQLVLLSTLASQRRDFSFKLKPVDLRNLSLLSALSVGLESSMTLTSLPPYTVPYRQLGIHVCHHRVTGEEILTAVDASVVALCVADISQAHRQSEDLPLMFESMPVCSCLGLGIIRGIDTRQGLLYLVTTLPRALLRKMNTILKGSLSLPDQIILKQRSSDPIPYVDALAPSTAVTAVRPRARMPRVTLGVNR